MRRKFRQREIIASLAAPRGSGFVATVNSNSNINFSATGTYSWVGRFKLTGFNGTSQVAVLFFKGSDTVSGYQILFEGGKFEFQERKTFTKWITTNFLDYGLLNRWFDVAVTFDGTNQIIKLYVDGVEYDSAVGSFSWANVVTDTTSALTFGKSATTEDFCGFMSDCAMFARVLTENEILKFSQGIMPTSPQVYAKMDDGLNAQTTLTDSSGNGNTITCTNASMWNPDAPFKPRVMPRPYSKSLSFNSATNDYATLPITPPSTGFGWAAWVFVPWRGSGTFGRVFDYIDGSTNGTRIILNENAIVGAFWTFDCKTAGTGGVNSTTGSLSSGRWIHIAVTNNGSGLNLIYINGFLNARNASSTYATPTAQTFTLGSQSNTPPGNAAKMLLSEIVYRPSAFTQAEVTALYYRGTLPSGTTCFITCDNNVTDQTGNGNNMTIVSGTTYSSVVPFKARNTASGRNTA